MLESSLIERYLAANSTQSAYSLTQGWTATDPESASANHRIALLGHSTSGKRYRGIRAQFFGDGADDSTFGYKVWTVHRGLSGSGPANYELRLFCSGVATLSTAAGVGSTGEPITSTEKIADTLTATSTGWGSAAVSATGSSGPTVETVASANTPCHLIIDDLGGDAYGVIIEFDLTGATGANCALERVV